MHDAGAPIAHLTDLQRRQERRVAREYTNLAIARRQNDLVDLGVDDLPLAGNDGEIVLSGRGGGHRIPYAASFFIYSARSSTCSMVPMSRKACSGMSSC